MTKPECFNRPDYQDRRTVQDGWLPIHRCYVSNDGSWEEGLSPKMIEIPNPMSKTCMQHTEFGEAYLHGWDCDGCRHLKDAPKVE